MSSNLNFENQNQYIDDGPRDTILPNFNSKENQLNNNNRLNKTSFNIIQQYPYKIKPLNSVLITNLPISYSKSNNFTKKFLINSNCVPFINISKNPEKYIENLDIDDDNDDMLVPEPEPENEKIFHFQIKNSIDNENEKNNQIKIEKRENLMLERKEIDKEINWLDKDSKNNNNTQEIKHPRIISNPKEKNSNLKNNTISSIIQSKIVNRGINFNDSFFQTDNEYQSIIDVDEEFDLYGRKK